MVASPRVSLFQSSQVLPEEGLVGHRCVLAHLVIQKLRLLHFGSLPLISGVVQTRARASLRTCQVELDLLLGDLPVAAGCSCWRRLFGFAGLPGLNLLVDRLQFLKFFQLVEL